MKKLFFFHLLVFCTISATAQKNIVLGDMNDDGQLTIGDITALSETVVGRQAVRHISIAGNPYTTDNTSIIGQWSGVSGKITFYADGTTDYKEGYSYEYLPAQCTVLFYSPSGAVVESLEVMKLSANKLVLANVSLTEYFTYGDRVLVDKNGHRYIDLGLPSGTLWATCNVGANSPEEYGYYFAWGETKTKKSYDGNTYLLSNKYGISNHIGSPVDNKTELDPEDDAATVNWGVDWRMPSLAQLEELFNSNNCFWQWTSLNGKNGYLVTSNYNGNSIFLPAAGFRGDTRLFSAGSVGIYWSRTLDTDFPEAAYQLGFSIDIPLELTGSDRVCGEPVRPVRK